MECISCQAEIRPGARFCRACGAAQPVANPAEVSSPRVAGVGNTAATATDPNAGVAPAADEQEASAGRLKRPPRVPRADASGAPDALETPQDMPAQQRPPSTGRAGTGVGSAATQSTPPSGTSFGTAQLPDTQAWQDAETIESGAIPFGGPSGLTPPMERAASSRATARAGNSTIPTRGSGSHGTGATPPPESIGGAMTLADGLPWPLPTSIIVGGRYRVEAVVSTEAAEADGENVYRVSDLQGYERCWSCETEYGNTGATDRFCRECGADMLAREFEMHERRATPDDQAAASAEPAKGVPLADAPTTQLAARTRTDPNAVSNATPSTTAEAERRFTQGMRSYRVAPRVAEPTPFPQGARILVGSATDVGRSRSGEHNEDSVAGFVLALGHGSRMQPLAFGMVADGLGGHINGQDASRLVTRMLTEHVLRAVALPLIGLPADAVATEDGLDAVLEEGARAANVALCAANNEADADMGSTLVAALVFEGTAYVANAGDSRAYVLEGDTLRRITTDHSLVEQLIAGGLIEPERRYTHPERNQIFRSLGDNPDMEIDIFTQKLRPGMRLLLCSDGLWEMVRDDELARILREHGNPQTACAQLVQCANENGGEDNISAVILEFSA